MKLISLNLGIRIDNTDKVVDFLLKQNADVVCLQEVADHKEESTLSMFKMKLGLDQALSRYYPYRHFSPLFQTNGFTKIKFGGFVEQGNYILSKFKILNSSTDFFHKSFIKTNDWKSVNFRVEDHGRALQTVELNCDGKTFRIMNIHGIWTADKMGDKRTIREIGFIIKKIKEKSIPTILVGDFNLSPASESIKILNKKMNNLMLEGKFLRTRPNFQDDLDHGDGIVDYVFINNLVESKKFEVLDSEISDHLPLVLEF